MVFLRKAWLQTTSWSLSWHLFLLICHLILYLFSLPLSTESAYDLLPRELQLPSSTQQNPKVMSQKSGGEAGPPPSAAIASGRILLLLSLFLLCEQDWSCPTTEKHNLCNSLYLWANKHLHMAGQPIRQAACCSVILTSVRKEKNPKQLLNKEVMSLALSELKINLYPLGDCETFET